MARLDRGTAPVLLVLLTSLGLLAACSPRPALDAIDSPDSLGAGGRQAVAGQPPGTGLRAEVDASALADAGTHRAPGRTDSGLDGSLDAARAPEAGVDAGTSPAADAASLDAGSTDAGGPGFAGIDAGSHPPPMLSDVTVAAGLGPAAGPTPPTRIYWMAPGMGVGDFNADGYPDLFAASDGQASDRLFLNDGDGGFVEHAAGWGLTAVHGGHGVALGDYDGDGRLDIYVTSSGPVDAPAAGAQRLYRNLGGSFEEVAQAAGVATLSTDGLGGAGAAFGDYDLDGDLDLMVLSRAEVRFGNRLFRNQGDGTFVDVTASALPADLMAALPGYQPVFIDMDGDRWPELLLAIDAGEARYLHNERDGTFADLSARVGADSVRNAMGQAIADLDLDGYQDWFVTSIGIRNAPGSSRLNRLFQGGAGQAYSEAAESLGVAFGDWAWGSVAADLNQDGLEELICVNGREDLAPYAGQPGLLWLNQGAAGFEDIAATAGFGAPSDDRSLAFLDLENDGDLDLVVRRLDGTFRLLRNDTSGAGGGLTVRLDTRANARLAPNGIGTRIVARSGGLRWTRILHRSPSYFATSEALAHFGIGSHVSVDLTVYWADGQISQRADVAANQRLTLVAPPALSEP